MVRVSFLIFGALTIPGLALADPGIAIPYGTNMANTHITGEAAASFEDNGLVAIVDDISEDSEIWIVSRSGARSRAMLQSPVFEGDVLEAVSGTASVTAFNEDRIDVYEGEQITIQGYDFSDVAPTNLSILRRIFVFTSGLIGRDDPDDVLNHVPAGGGIRG